MSRTNKENLVKYTQYLKSYIANQIDPVIAETEGNVTTATFNITAENTAITLQQLSNVSIDWGDGNINSELSHTYKTTGTYACKIYNAASIGEKAFYQNENLTSITIGNSVKEIGDSAFEDCSNLVNIVLPEGLTNIGWRAIRETAITNIVLPSTVTSVGSYAFYGCTKLKSCIMADGLNATFGKQIFGSDSSLTEVKLSNSLTRLPNQMFQNCTALKSIIIPKSVTTIDNGYTFLNCTNLTIYCERETLPASGWDSTWRDLSKNGPKCPVVWGYGLPLNTRDASGYVAKGAGHENRIWQTDDSGNPSWGTLGDAHLTWGGKSIAGGLSPVGAALSPEHSANRLAYLNGDALVFECSDDAGSNWTDLQWVKETKTTHVTLSNSFYIGSSSTVTTNQRSRMTLTAQDGTNTYLYTRPKKLLIEMSTSGHNVGCTVEYKTGASDATWKTLGTYRLDGWSGWNEIDVSSLTTLGGDTTQTSNNWYLRITYAITSVNANYATDRPCIMSVRLFGDACWVSTSNMGKTGHLYSYDVNQSATFPGDVLVKSGKKFRGDLEGNAKTATKVNSSLTVTLNSGSTEGTDKFTFNGETAKSINITPSAIGAAENIHTHTKSDITDFAHDHDDRYYIKTEIDNKITTALSSALMYKGTKDNTAALPTAGNKEGDVWNITNACAASGTLPKVNAGDNVAWNGSSWDVLAGTIDLSNYYVKSDVDSKLAGKSDTGHSHTKSEITDFDHNHDTKYTSTSILPNYTDNSETKTKYRISQKGWTGSGSTHWYYEICKFPKNDSSNYASAVISGRIGGWLSSNMSYINAIAWNRDTPGLAILDIGGRATAASTIWDRCNLILYTNSDGTATLYADCTDYFTFDLDLEVFQSTASITYTGNYSTSVSGTLSSSASSTPSRMEVINGEVYVAGTKLSKDGHGTHVTADTVKSALGTTTGTTKYLREDGTWATPAGGSSTGTLTGTLNGTCLVLKLS